MGRRKRKGAVCDDKRVGRRHGLQLAVAAGDHLQLEHQNTDGRDVLATLAVTPFAADRPPGVSDVQPRFAPDGGRLAWIGLEGAGGSSLWTADVDGTAARRLLTGPADLEGVAWTAAGDGPSLCALVHHTDADREWAYDRGSPIGGLDKALDEALARGWVVIDMANDWSAIHPAP